MGNYEDQLQIENTNLEKSALLVRRGNCSFSNKSKLAQDNNYDLLIIVDNKD